MAFTIKEIADLADVTTRTIRYYDEIGLLSPAETRENGYRYYNRDSLLRLQQILFFRELGVPLKEIYRMINHPDFKLVEALEKHQSSLKIRVKRVNAMITTINNTIEEIQGEREMTEKDYFNGFDMALYEDEVKERWENTPRYAESRKKWARYSKEQKESVKAEGRRIVSQMVGSDANISPDTPEVQEAVGEYHTYINKYFYACDIASLRGLADMWMEDDRFSANFEEVREGGAEFVREAVHIFCDRNG